MANEAHLAILLQGVEAWNAWRLENPDVLPDLRKADLSGMDLREANLSRALLNGAFLNRAVLSRANLGRATLSSAELSRALLNGALLSMADLCEADLHGADMTGAYLTGANLTNTHIWSTTFADLDLSEVRGLDMVLHNGPSYISIDSLVKSQGKIPESFLRGCGVPDSLIEYLPSLIGALAPFEKAFAQLLEGLKAVDAPPVPRIEPKNMPQEPEKIIARLKQRLAILEEQAAITGISVRPEVAIEIKDLRAEIGRLGG